MRDLPAVIWTRQGGAPAKLADLVFTDEEVRVSYDTAAASNGLPGVSALLPPEAFTDAPYVFRRTEALPVPPFIWSKIPLDNGDNVHRRILAGIVGRYDPPPPPGFRTDYEILLLAGRDGIGHLDFFRTDEDARRHYADARRKSSSPTVLDGKSGLWRAVGKALGEELAAPGAEAVTVDQILQAVGPTPSAGGMIPKFLFAIPDAPCWDGRVAATGTPKVGDTPYLDALVKIETAKYPGVVALESLCYDVHGELGCEVPRRWSFETTEGLRLLAVERFDRQGGRPMPLESFFSLANLATRGSVISPTGGSYEQVAKLLMLRDPAVSHVRTDAREMFKRFVIALLTGNGDLHLENMAILSRKGRRALSPVFDPAPMRAYDQHDMLAALPWMTGMQHDRFGIPGDLADRLLRLSGAFGVDGRAYAAILIECLAGTETYLDRVDGLEAVPRARKTRLRVAVEAVRYRLARQVGHGTGLGLSQVFGFAKQSGGEVRVESEVGTGTRFTLYLPSVAAPDAMPAEVAEPVVDGQGAAILVVEDNEDVGAFSTQALAELGYETVWAKDAEEALARLGEDGAGFDVVFSDVVMPGMDGIDLAREIGRRHPGLPVILASGYSHVLARRGTSGFELIHKPYSIEELSRVLRRAAGRQRRRETAATGVPASSPPSGRT